MLVTCLEVIVLLFVYSSLSKARMHGGVYQGIVSHVLQLLFV